MELVRAEGDVRGPLLTWFGVNFARLAGYFLVASFVSTTVFVLADPTLARERAGAVLVFTARTFLDGGLLALPGAVIWLWILSLLSPDLPARRRRLIAAVTAPPLIGVVWISEMLWSGSPSWVLALIYGVLFPAGAAWVVRDREISKKPLVDTGH